jgi:hypothetical protein
MKFAVAALAMISSVAALSEDATSFLLKVRSILSWHKKLACSPLADGHVKKNLPFFVLLLYSVALGPPSLPSF